MTQECLLNFITFLQYNESQRRLSIKLSRWDSVSRYRELPFFHLIWGTWNETYQVPNLSGSIKVGGGGVDGSKNSNLLNSPGKIADNRLRPPPSSPLANPVIPRTPSGNLFDPRNEYWILKSIFFELACKYFAKIYMLMVTLCIFSKCFFKVFFSF